MENKFTGIKDRVVKIAEEQAMSKEEFFKSIGMTSANFRGKAKDTPLNSNAIATIITKYPEVDLYWLIFGHKRSAYLRGEHLSEEPDLDYTLSCEQCVDKLEMITVLQEQVQELKADKEDLRALLGLQRSLKQ